MNRFFAPQPMAAVVLCRIALGSILFGSYASKLPSLQELYGPEGFGGYALHERVPGIGAGRPLEAPLQWLHAVESPELIAWLYGLLLLSCLAFAAGAFTRTSGVATWILHGLFHARSFTATLGWAVLIKPLLLFVILAPSGMAASVDAWRKRKGAPAPPVEQWTGPAWPVRLIQMQVCTMYAVNWLRLSDEGWLNGSMVFRAVSDRWYGRLDVDWLPLLPVLAVAAGATLVLELLAPVALWLRGVGRWWALGLIGLHASLELLANVGWWQPMMMSALCVFLPVAWIAPLFRGPRRVWSALGRPVRAREGVA